jgi:hypothetical protein
MTERDLRSTLQIVREFLKVSKDFEGITIQATPLRHPYWWLLSKIRFLDRKVKKRREAELSEQQIALLGELAVRYDGILFQLFDWTSTPVGFDTEATKIWYKIQGKAVTMRNYLDFSTTLWDVYLKHGNEIGELKPKFMLRQFVDEMPEGESRTALRSHAYPREVTLTADGREAARMVYEAYPVLHYEVLNLKSDLLRLTGEVLEPGEIAALESPYMRYHDWLFPQR